MNEPVGLYREGRESLRTIFERGIERNYTYALVGVSLVLLFLLAFILLALTPRSYTGTVISDLIGLTFIFILFTMNILFIGVFLSIIYWVYVRLRWNWRGFRPPYETGEFIIPKSKDGAPVVTVDRRTTMAIFGAFFNIFNVFWISALYIILESQKKLILDFLEGYNSFFSTQDLFSFLFGILRIDKNILTELGYNSVLGAATIIIGFLFSLLLFANISYLLRRGIRGYLKFRRQSALSRRESASIVLGNSKRTFDLLGIPFLFIIQDIIDGDLQTIASRFVISTFFLILSSSPVIFIIAWVAGVS